MELLKFLGIMIILLMLGVGLVSFACIGEAGNTIVVGGNTVRCSR